MKKGWILLAVLIETALAQANEVPALRITFTDGITADTRYELSSIRKIVFTDTDQMSVYLVDNGGESNGVENFAIDGIASILFANVTNEIEEVPSQEVFRTDNEPARKIIRNGQLLIIKDGAAYSIMGAKMFTL